MADWRFHKIETIKKKLGLSFIKTIYVLSKTNSSCYRIIKRNKENVKEMCDNWMIKCMDEKHRQEALDFVEKVFTVSEREKEGKTVRSMKILSAGTEVL